MIDARFQRNGFGRDTLEAVVRRLRERPDCRLIRTSYGHDNLAASRLCELAGFEPAGDDPAQGLWYGEIRVG